MLVEKKNFIFAKLAEIAEVRKLTEEERTAYDVSLRKYRDTKAVINMQKAEGIEIGMAKKEIEMIVSMKKAGLPTEQISMIAKLPIEEVNNILRQTDAC